uniref:Uncharacterized protein n=1 Tax=Ditylenchus dipsaci TaxID=166011 RepID=A0A915D0Z2_9BILA
MFRKPIIVKVIPLSDEILHMIKQEQSLTYSSLWTDFPTTDGFNWLSRLKFRREFEKRKHCPGLRYLKSPISEPVFEKLRNEVLPKAEKSASSSNQTVVSNQDLKLASFYKAVSQWLFTESVYNPSFSNFNDLTLDYLLQMTISGDTHPWVEFVDAVKVNKYIDEEIKFFSQCCHLKRAAVQKMAPTSPTSIRADSLTKLFSILDLPTMENVLFPVVPLHQNLPVCEKMDLYDCYNMARITSKFSQYLDEVNKTAKIFITGKEAVETLNNGYLDLFQKLYAESKKVLIITMRCGNFLVSKCSKPVSVEAVVDTCTYDQSIADKMNENRRKREEQISKLLMIVDATAIQCAHSEHICSDLNATSPKEAVMKVGDQIRVTSITLFYKICNSVATTQLLFPAGVDCYEACLNKLGKAFISENPAEQLNLMRVVLGGNPLNHFLIQHFTPHCIPPEMLFQLYSELSNSVRNASTSEASLALLSRLDIEHAGNQMPANHFSDLMPVIFENMASVTGTSPLRQLCVEHFVHSMFHYFPLNFASGLRLILSGCDSQSVPVEIFSLIANRIDLDRLLEEEWNGKVVSNKLKFTADQSLECLRIISEQLGNSRHVLSTRLYSVWSQYLEMVCKLADYFLRLVVFHKFRAELTTVAIEKELRDVFYLLVSVWAPLLEPVNSGLPPWNATDNQLAANLVDKFVAFLTWLPHCTYLPPGAETVEALLWQYFTAKMIGLQRAGTAHIFSVYEVKLVRLNWARFWPNLLDLSTVENSLVERPAEISPLIVELVVRFPWLQLIQHQANQPEDAHKAFYSLLLSIFAHCVYRNANYAKSRASMENLLKMMLDNCNWQYVKVEMVEKTGAFMVASFPNDCLLNPNEVLKTLIRSGDGGQQEKRPLYSHFPSTHAQIHNG